MERLTIDEAIAFCYEKSNNIKLKAEPEVFIQLAEQLEELKELKEYFNSAEIGKYRFQKGYNKAIDDFVKELQKKIEKDLANPDLALECKKCGIWKNYDIEEIAEQLKAGGKDE